MTRIFDALRKVQSARPAMSGPAPVPPPAELTPSFAAPLRSAPLPGIASAARLLPAMMPLPAIPLSDDVLREMGSLRVSIESALGGERASRVVLFAASQRGEGTSTIVAQFASYLARDPQTRVVLVDAHSRRSEFSPDRLSADLGARDVASPIAPVQVLPLASAVPGTLSPAMLREAIDALGAGFGWVIVDAPPVLEAPEAAPMAAVADGAVLVVHAGRTKRPVLARSADLLRKAGARLLGTVLNHRRLEIPDFIYRRI